MVIGSSNFGQESVRIPRTKFTACCGRREWRWDVVTLICGDERWFEGVSNGNGFGLLFRSDGYGRYLSKYRDAEMHSMHVKEGRMEKGLREKV